MTAETLLTGAAAQVAPAAVELRGTVERVTFYNPENGFSVVKLRVRGRREPIAVVGTLPAAQPGETLLLTGEWRTDPRHGAQFQPLTAELQAPTERDEIVRYLGSGLIRQLGPVLAQRIVDTFGERTLEVLDEQPQRVREVPGVGRQRAAALAEAWVQHRALRAVSAFLAEHGLDRRYAPRLVAAYGEAAPRVVGANPYRLVPEVPGFGFAAADKLGQSLGARATGAARLQAAVHAVLLRASERGHTRLPRETVLVEAAKLASVEETLLPPAVTQLLGSGVLALGASKSLTPGRATPSPSKLEQGTDHWPLTTDHSSQSEAPVPASASGRLRIYEPAPSAAPTSASETVGLAGLLRAEESLAEALRTLALRPIRESAAAVDGWLARDADAASLSEEQRAAVRTAALSGCFVLTGGPGVGKTTTLRALARCLHALGRSVTLAAPTGKAAKRLSQVVGVEAKTLHRLLGAGPHGFRFGAREPLPFDVVIVDEASMLDTSLARALTAAIGRHSRLILVGDADQLPSVGPGQVLRDVLNSGVVPAVRLETIFRQAAQSRIVTNAHRIRHGEPPELAAPAALAQGVDCVFVPAPSERLAEIAAQWAAERLPRLAGLAPGDVQTLAPLTRVCQGVNALLQERLNPAHGQPERPHGALALREGDRVIQTRNNYTLGVFNGDTGSVAHIHPDRVVVDFGDDRLVEYSDASVLDLEHAYCLTVHRAQGSEWPGVVLLASSSFGPMLSRNLLYTALTRAKKVVVIVGDRAAIEQAVRETRDRDRYTGLAALLRPNRPDAVPADADFEVEAF